MDTEEILQKLRPILGDKLDALWLEYQLNPRKRSEIEGFLQLLAAKHLGKPYVTKQILLEPPPPEQSKGEYRLGTVLYGDKEYGSFGLREHELIQHVGIFGRTGSGKTNVGFLITKSLLARGIPILVFDWKRNYRDLLQILGPAELAVYTVGRDTVPFAFSPLAPPEGTKPSIWLKKLIEIMCHVYWLGEGVAYLLQEAIDAVYDQSGVYSGSVESWPTLADVKEWLSNAKVKGREGQWMDSAKRAIGTLCYGDIGKVLNVRQPTDLSALLKTNSVLELDALTNTDKTFLIETMLLWIHHYRLQEKSRETLKHAVIIEEAHHVLLKRKQSKETVMDVVLREIRELGEAIILIDQHPSLISVPSLGNTYCTIAMNLKHGHDVGTIANATLLNAEEKEYLGKLPVGYGIVRLQGRWYKPFLVKFPLVELEKGKVTDKGLAGQKLSFSVPGADILPIEKEEREILPMRGAEKLTKEEIELLKDVLEKITSGVAERFVRLGLSSYFGNKVRNSLVAKGLIEPVGISTGKGRVVLLWLTEKGKDVLKNLGLEVPI
ncbi:MAG: ATP-binding protein [Candidatus Binatia bacterium]